MSWIRMAIAGAALIGAASVAGAQGPQGGPPQGGEQRGRMGGRGDQMLFQGIDLTDAQKDQIQKIKDKYRAEREALRPKGDAGARPDGGRPQIDDATRQKMDAIRTKSNAEFRAVLTPAQQTIFDKNIADMKARMEQWQGKKGEK
ncbi:MAG TPA: Spy/CpxP family protein refolding chaperone [Gemmatimonadaceae bacterium]|nr:Spy/CpxP family protein refolding chaperone [Gemmatimonadaceae bacterium]